MEYPTVVIPSYKRSDTIATKTLRYLKSRAYPTDKIFIFVANEEEAGIYRAAVPAHLYNSIVVGVVGLCAQRNFITNYYPEGEILLQMDDDVVSVRGLELDEILRRGLEALRGGSGLFGVMPNDDARTFKDRTTEHLTHILGSFFLCRNHWAIRITKTEKEDLERSILYFKMYGKVHRLQCCGVSTGYGKGTGGLQMPGRQERIKEEIQNMVTLYPGYCKAVMKKKGEDILLNWRAVKS